MSVINVGGYNNANSGGLATARSTWDFTNLSSVLSHATFQPVFLVHRYTVSVIFRLLGWRDGSSQTLMGRGRAMVTH